MYKLFLTLFMVAILNADVVDGVSVVVEDEVITLLDTKKDKLYELGGTLPDSHYKWDKKKSAEDDGNDH